MSPSYCSYSIKKLTAKHIMIFLRAILEISLQLKILPEKITKETFMGKHVKGIMYFSFFLSLKIYCQTVQRQNARLSQLQIKMSSLKDCIFSEVLFFVSPTPHYVPRETKIEPDRRLPPGLIWTFFCACRRQLMFPFCC